MIRDRIQCINKQADKLLNRYHINGSTRQLILNNLNTYLNKSDTTISPPEGVQYLNRTISELTGISDLYAVEKVYYDRFFLEKYETLKKAIGGENSREKALMLTLSANIIDVGQPNPNFNLKKTLKEALNTYPIIDHTEELLDAISNARTILYLGDNAGEIVLDKLFIETLAHPNIYYAVRGGYVLNDSTREDANWVGMNRVAKVIDNGFDAPATILKKCSQKFIRIFDKADIIIAKGQGNLESLISMYDKSIFFLSMVKCHVIAGLLGVNIGKTIVWYNQIKRNTLTDKSLQNSLLNKLT